MTRTACVTLALWGSLAATALGQSAPQAYCLFKRSAKDYRASTNPQRQADRTVSTLGTRVAHSLKSGWTLTGESAGLRGTYYHLTAFHPFAGSAATFGTGLNRGDLYEVRFDYAYSPAFKGHVLYEHLAPGSFYARTDGGYFFRVEFIYTLTKSFPVFGSKAR